MLKKLILPLFLLSSICTNNIFADLIVLPRQESGGNLNDLHLKFCREFSRRKAQLRTRPMKL
ncbi:MAG: hypothetical protein K1000chlam3_01737 [Chlamydiae bacterium]|nr:hypothetical protein [Chlamydiota bacterium]